MKCFPFFTLRVAHSYYADGRCFDFSIEPSPATETLLKNQRCVVKSLPDGIRVLIELDEEGKPLIAYPQEITFTFYLLLRNPEFALFTDLSDIAGHPAPLYTTARPNAEPSRELQLVSKKAWHSERFTVENPAQTNRFVLSGCPSKGLAMSQFEVIDSENVQLVEYNEAEKSVTVNTQSATKEDTFVLRYSIRPRLKEGVFAEVDIYDKGTLKPAEKDATEFKVVFEAGQARWKYYFVTDLKSSAEKEFKIQHTELAFSDTNRRNLTEMPDPSDEMGNKLVERYPKLQILRFISDDLISCRQKARKNLELHFDGNCLLKALPNPSLRNYSRIKVGAGDNVQMQYALFQVIKYITKPIP